MKNIFLIFLTVTLGIFPSFAMTPINFTAIELQDYLKQISSMMTGRPLLAAEAELVTREGEPGLQKVLQTWLDSDFFVESSKLMMQTQLGISGNDGTVNYELPGNLMSYLVRQSRPYSEIITANYCVSNSGVQTACDANAPFAAGVLATRGYLKQYASRFNLARAHNMMRQFACLEYPMDPALQVPLQRQDMISMFKVDQSPGSNTFGNGTACYSCHSQFGAHAQFFVKFDEFGTYQVSADGQQDPNSEPGRARNRLFASHLESVSLSSVESSQMFGQQVENLKAAASVLAANRNFTECAVRNSIRYFVRLTEGNAAINSGVVKQVTDSLKAKYGDPNFKQIVLQSLSHPMVIGSVLHAGE